MNKTATVAAPPIHNTKPGDTVAFRIVCFIVLTLSVAGTATAQGPEGGLKPAGILSGEFALMIVGILVIISGGYCLFLLTFQAYKRAECDWRLQQIHSQLEEVQAQAHHTDVDLTIFATKRQIADLSSQMETEVILQNWPQHRDWRKLYPLLIAWEKELEFCSRLMRLEQKLAPEAHEKGLILLQALPALLTKAYEAVKKAADPERKTAAKNLLQHAGPVYFSLPMDPKTVSPEMYLQLILLENACLLATQIADGTKPVPTQQEEQEEAAFLSFEDLIRPDDNR